MNAKSRLYIGICIYADDIILLSPSRTGLQEMVKICEKFAKATKLKFSTNIRIEKCKTKCLIFSKEKVNYNKITPILLNELPLPFVNDLKHLGNVLQSDNSMTIDCNKKRAIFISKIHSLNLDFFFNNSEVILKLYNIYYCKSSDFTRTIKYKNE